MLVGVLDKNQRLLDHVPVINITETWDGDSMTPMETATAESTVADLEASVVEIGFVPFAQYTA